MAEAPALQEDIPHAAHPLEPLCADEIRAAVAIVRDEQNLDGRALFETVELREPDKAVVRGFAPGHDVVREANVVIAVAGMEGALPSVVAGLVRRPVIAVPTSVGYGASFGGVAALLGMLNSCGSGVTVVNIDNGFGAGFAANQINALASD